MREPYCLGARAVTSTSRICLLKKLWEKQLQFCQWWPRRFIRHPLNATSLTLLYLVLSEETEQLEYNFPRFRFPSAPPNSFLYWTSKPTLGAKLKCLKAEQNYLWRVQKLSYPRSVWVAQRDFHTAGFFMGYLIGFNQKVTSGCRT